VIEPEDQSSDPGQSPPSTDEELFDTATDIGGPDDGAIHNPNSDT
jgi:hypothetical protein